ncbi:MAG: DUF3052 domain-containing protein [Bacteroidota bacterium]
MAEYAVTPLWKKLGLKEGHRCYLYQIPENYFELLEAVPVDTEFSDDFDLAPFDFMHVFITESKELLSYWSKWKDHLKKDGSLWVSWPKRSAKIQTDLNGNTLRTYGLKGGLVEAKVCSIDVDWSALKFMYRKGDR